jgi:hypothetical protein
VRFRERIRLLEPDRASNVEFFAIAPAVGGGGKMSRDCSFKCAMNKHKHKSALKDCS